LPDTILQGEVKEIANTAFTRYAGTAEEVTNFLVKIRVLDNMPQLKPGMWATVDITTATHENVLHVPIQCVVMREPKSSDEETEKTGTEAGNVEGEDSQEEDTLTDEDKSEAGEEAEEEEDEDEEEKEPVEVVFVVNEGEAEMRPVKTGIMGELDVEISEGLEEGDMVITGSYRVLSKTLRDGQKVKVEKKRKGSSSQSQE